MMDFDSNSNLSSHKRYEKIQFLGEGQVCCAEWFNILRFIHCIHSLQQLAVHPTNFVFTFVCLQFATVFKAKDLKEDSIVAVKKVSFGSCSGNVNTKYSWSTFFVLQIKVGSKSEFSDGVNRTALREIKLQQELHHPNVLGLLDVFGHKSNISLVFDYMDTDLEVIIRDNKIVLTPANIKAYTIMTLQGLEYLHANFILHRVSAH